MEDSAIPETDETTIRMGCLQAATSLNEMRDKPYQEAADVIDDATLFEHYLSNGATVAIVCSDPLKVLVRRA